MVIKMKSDEFNEQFYNNIAKHYDKNYHPEHWSREFATEEEKMFIMKNIIKNGCTLEIGIGQGRFTGMLSDISKKVTAIDVSSEILEIAKERHKNRNNIEFVKQDIKKLKSIENYGHFDSVILFWLLPHIEDMRNVLLTVREAVKTTGIIIFDLWNKNSIYRDYLAKERERKEKENNIPAHWKDGSVYTKFLSFQEMTQLINDANLKILEHYGRNFIPLHIYRGSKFFFPVFKYITDPMGRLFFKDRCYNNLFACKKA